MTVAPAHIRNRQDEPVLEIQGEMIVPAIGPRVEDRSFPAGLVVSDRGPVSFPKITRPAREGQIRFVVRPVPRTRDDVLDLERKVQDELGCQAVFAALSGTPRYHRVTRVHRSRWAAIALARSVAP